MKDENQTREALKRLEDLFSFSLRDAQQFIALFHDEMQRGLAGKPGSLKMIPSYVGRPSGHERGDFLALDLGGTNLRVLAVRLDGEGKARITAFRRWVIPEKIMQGTGEALFDFMAEGVALFLDQMPPDSPQLRELAFTFSFPVAQSAVDAGVLLNWTKGFTAKGVSGKEVVALLSAALAHKNMPDLRVVALTNDTVGTLMAQSYTDPACDMGVILGTGTNACYPEKAGRIAKLAHLEADREVIVNLEWGSFDRIQMNAFDSALDSHTLNPGAQRLEKMVSGLYLGELARRVALDLIDAGVFLRQEARIIFEREQAVTSEHLSQIAEGEDVLTRLGVSGPTSQDCALFAGVSRVVTTRAARIAAAAIAAGVTWMDADLQRRHTIAIDGSLFEKCPGFQETMEALLIELFGDRATGITLCHAADGSGIGAAIIAAVAAGALRQI